MHMHKNKYNNMFDWKKSDVLDFERHWFKRSILEMKLIKSVRTMPLSKKKI